MSQTYSLEEFRQAVIEFLERFMSSAGDDHATLTGDISGDMWSNPQDTTDPAAWFDWVESLMKVRGMSVGGPLMPGINEVRLADGTSSLAVVEGGRNTVWRPPTRPPATDGVTEVGGINALREWVRSSWRERSVITITDLLQELRSEEVSTAVPGLLAAWEHGRLMDSGAE